MLYQKVKAITKSVVATKKTLIGLGKAFKLAETLYIYVLYFRVERIYKHMLQKNVYKINIFLKKHGI